MPGIQPHTCFGLTKNYIYAQMLPTLAFLHNFMPYFDGRPTQQRQKPLLPVLCYVELKIIRGHRCTGVAVLQAKIYES